MSGCKGIYAREGVNRHRMVYLTHDGCRPCGKYFIKGKYLNCPCCGSILSKLPKNPKSKLNYDIALAYKSIISVKVKDQ